MLPHYYEILSTLKPYIICYRAKEKFSDSSLWGFPLDENLLFNSLNPNTANFAKKVLKLDAMAFGGQGMGMPPWVFFDCGIMPGFAFGFAICGNNLSKKDRDKLQISQQDYFPISLYMALPMEGGQGAWFGHNLSSLNGVLEKDLKGLGFLTKLSALKLFNIKHQIGATQWDNRAVLIHKKFGPLEVLSPQVSVHNKKNTFSYRCLINDYDFLLEKQSHPFSHSGVHMTDETITGLNQYFYSYGEKLSIQDIRMKDGELLYHFEQEIF